MARIREIIVDCSHPASLARFWATVLDGYSVAPYDEAELERLRALGVDDPEDDPAVLVVGPPGGPRLFFQRVPESKTVKNRVHLDLADDDVQRLVELGASVFAREEAWTVLHDPEGNEFCLFGSSST
jgi:hypothetical protein